MNSKAEHLFRKPLKSGRKPGERRQRAEEKGIFTSLRRLSGKEISSFFQGKPLVGWMGHWLHTEPVTLTCLLFCAPLLMQPVLAVSSKDLGAGDLFTPFAQIPADHR